MYAGPAEIRPRVRKAALQSKLRGIGHYSSKESRQPTTALESFLSVGSKIQRHANRIQDVRLFVALSFLRVGARLPSSGSDQPGSDYIPALWKRPPSSSTAFMAASLQGRSRGSLVSSRKLGAVRAHDALELPPSLAYVSVSSSEKENHKSHA